MFARHPRGDELLDEIDAHASRQEQYSASASPADLRQLGGVVELTELGVHLLDELPC